MVAAAVDSGSASATGVAANIDRATTITASNAAIMVAGRRIMAVKPDSPPDPKTCDA
ncbi:hypothetical protein GCM10025785_03770 [Corynebacterium canis]